MRPCAGAPRLDEATETLARLYNEVLGLIPYELEPAAPVARGPGAGLMARIAGEIAGDETQPALPEPPRAVAPVQPAPVPVMPPPAAGAADGGGPGAAAGPGGNGRPPGAAAGR